MDAPGNWSQGLPTAQQDVVIDGSCTVTNPTPALASLKVNSGRTLTFNGWQTVVTATVVTVEGNVTHAVNAATATNTAGIWPRDHRVWFAASNVTISGTINADYKGWQGTSANKGYGEGATALDRGGAGHGGRGSQYTAGVWGGPVYGVSDAPEAPGSGGNGAYGSMGGHGGGAVRIDASGHVLVNGTISANASSATDAPGNSGGGSGGSVFISCATFGATNGVIRANGGGGGTGGGGGGRIAVVCNDTASQGAIARPKVSYSVLRGLGGGQSAEHGTLHLNSDLLIPYTMSACNGQLVGLPSWSLALDRLSLSNSWVQFPNGLPGVALAITHDLTLNNSTIDVFGYTDSRTPTFFDVGGNVTLTNASKLYLYGGVTDGTTANPGGRFSVTGEVCMATNCVIYPTSHGTNGGSVFLRVSNLFVSAGASINADSRGYSVGYGPGKPTERHGSGHGGKGCSAFGSTPFVGGPTNGNPNAPITPGSGSNYRRGGGTVWIQADDKVTVDGSVTAIGTGGSHDVGAAAGGSIYIQCRRITGGAAGILSARGGNTSGTSGGGGGGRVAVIYNVDQFGSNKVSVAGGIHSTDPAVKNGAAGSLRWAYDPMGMLPLFVEGQPARRGSPTPYAYGQNSVAAGETVTVTVDSPADELAGQHYTCTGWLVTNALGFVASGGTTQAVFAVATDTWLTWYWTNEWHLTSAAGPGGSLQTDKTGWHTDGTQITLFAVPSDGNVFMLWSGDVPNANRGENPLTLTMDRCRTVRAQFANLTAEDKTWSGSGDWYDNPENWSPAGLPGTNDRITVSAGSTLALAEPANVGELRVAGVLSALSGDEPLALQVNGNLTITGAAARVEVRGAELHTGGDMLLQHGGSLYTYGLGSDLPGSNYCALVNVTGKMILLNGSWVYPTSHGTLGGSALFTVGSMSIASNAGFNADARGYAGKLGLGNGPGSSIYTGRAGAGHGGKGGYAWETHQGGPMYGSSNAPVLAGSSGGSDDGDSGGNGGGAIRIKAASRIVLDGTLTANGGGGSHDTGTGSGGSIYLIAGGLHGSGTLSAKGGNTGGTSGGGGGGRIAVWSTSLAFPTANATVAGGIHSTDTNRNGAEGTIVWGVIPAKGTLVLLR